MSSYWDIVEPVWEAINIYDGPDIFLETFAQAPAKSGLLFAAYFCQYEICNGGFHQFFDNSTGVLAPEAVRGFRAIGQNEIAGLVESAMRSFGNEYPRDRDRRQLMLEKLGRKVFDHLDKRFYDLLHVEAGGFSPHRAQHQRALGTPRLRVRS